MGGFPAPGGNAPGGRMKIFPRRYAQVSLGVHVPGVCVPGPDRTDPMLLVLGALKRFVRGVPELESTRVAHACLRSFCNTAGSLPVDWFSRLSSSSPMPDISVPFHGLDLFVRSEINRWELEFGVEPISADEDLSVEHWLCSTHYTQQRKAELLLAWRDHPDGLTPHDAENKSFLKNERYAVKDALEYKHARCINSRRDYFKCLTGPAFHAMEKILFQRVPYFVKYVRVADRPRYITQLLGAGTRVLSTDHTAFEAHMTPAVLCACELQMYRYMLSRCANGRLILQAIVDSLSGVNRCFFDGFIISVPGVRMSGDMCTSLGNGLTNWFTMAYAHRLCGVDCLGVVEGDDGAFVDHGVITPALMATLGMELKVAVANTPGRAGFCKMHFTEDDFLVVRDPALLFSVFGWSDHPARVGGLRVRRELLRAKSLSLLAEMPRCPMVTALALYGIRVTDGATPRWFGNYWESIVFQGEAPADLTPWMLEQISCGISTSSRLLCEELFGVPIAMQLDVENWLSGLKTIQPLDHPSLFWLCSHPAWLHCWENFVDLPMGTVTNA